MSLKTIDELIELLHLLPGVGYKSSERMAYQLLEMDETKVLELSSILASLHKKITKCPICGAYKEDKCIFCDDENKDGSSLLVVSNYKDALAFENLKTYHGRYHILNGNLSSSKGLSSEDINLNSLLKRIKNGNIKEVILATDPTVDGETTALYIAKLLENENIKITRLAYGLPMGSQLTYADDLTLLRSLEGRKSLK